MYYLILSVTAILLGLLLLRNGFLIIKVRGQSMLPTLQEGDRLLVLRYWPKSWLKKDHIVISKMYPLTLPTNYPLALSVKRIHGLAGDIINTKACVLDPVSLSKNEDGNYLSRYEEKTWHIPPGYVFLQGDNLGWSGDSRALGPIPLSNILGIAIAHFRNEFPNKPI